MPRQRVALLALLVASLHAPPGASSVPPQKSYLTGDPRDVSPPLFGPALVLSGGGNDVDEAWQWAVDAVRGCRAPCATRIDLVVLRVGGADSYNAPLFALDGVDSVETLVVGSREDAQYEDFVQAVRRSEMVFLPGGDPCRYVRLLRGTRVADAVDAVYDRGGAVAGSSAGLVAAGGLAPTACAGRVDTRPALADPYDRRLDLSAGPFHFRATRALIAEPHFVARDRMGRTVALLARQLADGAAPPIRALAVDEDSAVTLDYAGRAAVRGGGLAYLLVADRKPEVCRRGEPLTYSGVKVWRMAPGRTYDLDAPPDEADYTVSVREGALLGDPY